MRTSCTGSLGGLPERRIRSSKRFRRKKKGSRVRSYINEKGKRTYYKKWYETSYIKNGKQKIISDNPNIVKMLNPLNYLTPNDGLRDMFSSSSPSQIQRVMYAKRENEMPYISKDSSWTSLPEYGPTLKDAKKRELILIRLILLRTTYFQNEYAPGDLLSQLIEVQSRIIDLEKKDLGIDPNSTTHKKKIKKFNINNIFKKESKMAEESKIIEEYTYFKHPHYSILAYRNDKGKIIYPDNTKKVKETKGVWWFDKYISLDTIMPKERSKNENIELKTKAMRPLLPETIEYDCTNPHPPILILTPHEELYKMYYGEREYDPHEAALSHIIMKTDVTTNYRAKQYKDWKANLERWAVYHREALISVSEDLDFKKITVNHKDYLWLQKRYMEELHEAAIEYKHNQLDVNKIREYKNIKLYKDLPPLPILEGNDIQVLNDKSEKNTSKDIVVKEYPGDGRNWDNSAYELSKLRSGTSVPDKDLPVQPFKREKENLINRSVVGKSVIIEDKINEGDSSKKEEEFEGEKMDVMTIEKLTKEESITENNIREENDSIKKEEDFHKERKEDVSLKEKQFKAKLVMPKDANAENQWGLTDEELEKMTADELEVYLAPEIKRAKAMSDYWRKGVEAICGKIPEEKKTYGDRWDEWTPYILKLKRWQEYYDQNAYRLEADYYNPNRFPDPVEDPESTDSSELASDVDTESVTSHESGSKGETNSLVNNTSDKESLQDSDNEGSTKSFGQDSGLENNQSHNLKKQEEDSELPNPELIIEYTDQYYRMKKLLGEDAHFVRQIEEDCRRKAVEKFNAANKIIEDKRIAKETERQKLIDNGIDPDNPNALWVNNKALETVCIAVLDRAIGGLTYKINKLDWETEWRDNANKLRMTLAESWELIFNGGPIKSKLDSAYYENVVKLKELSEEKKILYWTLNAMDDWKEHIKYQQTVNLYGSNFTESQQGDLDDERIFWLQEIVDQPKKQEEVIKYIQDYIKRVDEKKVSKSDLAEWEVINYVKIYLREQKAGKLNLKPFKEMKPDIMTMRYLEHFLEIIRKRRDNTIIGEAARQKEWYAELAKMNAWRAKEWEPTPQEEIDEEARWIAEKRAEIERWKREIAEDRRKESERREKDW